MPLKLPDVAIFRRGTASLPGHVYAEEGEALIYLNGWEADSISPETAKPSTIGWLRNGEREGWFCVPWRDGNIWRGFFPDFLIVREDGERLVLDIIDPHDHTKPDAVGKAKGLSDYAGKHADLLGHMISSPRSALATAGPTSNSWRSATSSMRSRRSANCTSSMSAKGDAVAVYTMEA